MWAWLAGTLVLQNREKVRVEKRLMDELKAKSSAVANLNEQVGHSQVPHNNLHVKAYHTGPAYFQQLL